MCLSRCLNAQFLNDELGGILESPLAGYTTSIMNSVQPLRRSRNNLNVMTPFESEEFEPLTRSRQE